MTVKDHALGSGGESVLDLKKSRILYVGGRHRSVQHLRRVVEEHNGRFVHHDGGVEQSLNRLDAMLEGADAVLFPVECVSHAAQYRVKHSCQRHEKPFVPLRRAGIWTVLQALAAVIGAPVVAPCVAVGHARI